jgi:hypothetical protein
MAQKLLELHQLAAQAQVFHTQYVGGMLTAEQYREKVIHLHDHGNIQPSPEHEVACAEYREIIEGALRLVEGK